MTRTAGSPSSEHPTPPAHRRPARLAKRLIDITISATALAVLSPVIAAIAIAIRLTMGPPVLFRHVRPGYLARPFELIKFRSMLQETAADGRKLSYDERVTKLGYFLRKTSLDEVPELWNVLKGEMSIVGPRPLIMEYLPRYSAEQARRHEVRPGITGLAQITGRHTLAWDERFRLDVWYVDHWTLREDLRIMLATARIALHGSGMPDPTAADWEFMGSANDAPAADASTVSAGADLRPSED